MLKRGLLSAVLFLMLAATGCASQTQPGKTETGKTESMASGQITESDQAAETEVVPVDLSEIGTGLESIQIPEGTRIVGLGEAVHGSKELQVLKRQMMEILNTGYGVKTFILEGDFGGCSQVNTYIHGGEGTAEEAVKKIGFTIYKTEEMADFVEWLRTYNDSVSEADKISFFGCDMQRLDENKAIVSAYLSLADDECYDFYEPILKEITDDTMYDVAAEDYQGFADKIEKVGLMMDERKEHMIAASTEKDFAFARQAVNILAQACELQGAAPIQYSRLRDEFMAENTNWILDYEEQYAGRSCVLLSGHTGHIEKTSANLAGYKSMGNYLAEQWGTSYFAIGTDILNAGFNSYSSASDKRQDFEVTNANALTKGMENDTENVCYVSMAAARSSPAKEAVESDIAMLNVGEDFSEKYSSNKLFYTISMVPAESYDGVILYKKTSPMHLLQ